MKRLFLAAILAGTLSFSAFAQQTAGNLRGETTPGATIEIFAEDIGARRTVTAGKDGKYRFAKIPPSVYDVTITHADGTVEHRAVNVIGHGATTRLP